MCPFIASDLFRQCSFVEQLHLPPQARKFCILQSAFARFPLNSDLQKPLRQCNILPPAFGQRVKFLISGRVKMLPVGLRPGNFLPAGCPSAGRVIKVTRTGNKKHCCRHGLYTSYLVHSFFSVWGTCMTGTCMTGSSRRGTCMTRSRYV